MVYIFKFLFIYCSLNFIFHTKRCKKSLNKQCRYCRAGCGVESEPGNGDTPGFKAQLFDVIEYDPIRKLRILSLKRPQNHVKAMSKSMLQSWRANCDASIILYDTDVSKLCPQDIANISGYVVSYCTKGNVTYLQEQRSLARVIDDFEPLDASNDDVEVKRLSKKMFNSLFKTRMISKPETCCELLQLDLYWCTEQFRSIRLSKNRKIQNPEEGQTVSKDHCETYSSRTYDHHLSMHEFFTNIGTKAIENAHAKHKKDFKKLKAELRRYNEGHKHLDFAVMKKSKKKLEYIENIDNLRLRRTVHSFKEQIIHPIGMNCLPCYPVSRGYAISTLVLHKPWQKERPLSFEADYSVLEKEFYNFVLSPDCPLEVLLSYHNAVENHYRLQRNSEPVIGEDYGTCDSKCWYNCHIFNNYISQLFSSLCSR